MSANLIEFDPLTMRRFEIACETERLASRDVTPAEMTHLVNATIGKERINFDLIGRVLTEKLRLKEERP